MHPLPAPVVKRSTNLPMPKPKKVQSLANDRAGAHKNCLECLQRLSAACHNKTLDTSGFRGARQELALHQQANLTSGRPRRCRANLFPKYPSQPIVPNCPSVPINIILNCRCQPWTFRPFEYYSMCTYFSMMHHLFIWDGLVLESRELIGN